MSKYSVKIRLNGFPEKIVKVEGEPIAIQGKEYISLFVYFLPSISFGDKICIFADCWQVAEEKTGMPVGRGCNKQAAISHALAVLNRHSKEKTIEQIEKYKKNKKG
ncbi:MAG: hypothetical protein ACYDDE_03970 [bacterium]